MRPAAALCLAALLAGCGRSDPPAPTTPSTLVTTVDPQQGSAARWIIAYGTATPASNGVDAVSVLQPGQVTRILVTPGAKVAAGQPLVEFATAPSAQASFEAAATTLATAREARATTARLLGQQLATRDQLAQADKAVADAAAALSAARQEGGGQATRTLRAAATGVVATVPVNVGDRTQPGTPLVTVARADRIVVTVGVAPADRGALRVGAAARLHPLDGGSPVNGRVLRVDGQLNPATRLLDVDLAFPPGAVLPGQALRADIASGSVSGWIVPHAAVVTDETGAHVFQIVSGKASPVPVAVLQAGRDHDVVRGAIAPGSPLILDGAFQVGDGDAVRQARR